MIIMRAFALVFALALLAPMAAFAEGAASECRAGEQDCTEHVFTDGDTLEAGIRRPGESIQATRRPVRRPSLIRPRIHFVREIIETAENL